MWTAKKVTLTDKSVVWNVTGHTDGDENDVGTPIEIGCEDKRHAASLANSLNKSSFIYDTSI